MFRGANSQHCPGFMQRIIVFNINNFIVFIFVYNAIIKLTQSSESLIYMCSFSKRLKKKRVKHENLGREISHWKYSVMGAESFQNILSTVISCIHL